MTTTYLIYVVYVQRKICDTLVMQTTGWWLEAAVWLSSCSTAPSGGKIATLFLSNWAYWGRGRSADWTIDAPITVCEALTHRTDRGATIPWSSHPGEGRCSIRKEGIPFIKSCLKGGIERKMSYQGKKNIPKITVSKKKGYLRFIGCGNSYACFCKSLHYQCYTLALLWILNVHQQGL